MSDEELKLRIKADVGDAVDGAKKVRDELEGVGEGAKRAGGGVRFLGEEMRSTKDAIAAANAKLAEVRDTTEEASLASRAFGENSKAAKEAQRAQAAAMEAAKEAARAAKAEVEKLSAALEKAKSEGTATATQISRMEVALGKAELAADKTAKSVHRLELNQMAAARASESASVSFGQLRGATAGSNESMGVMSSLASKASRMLGPAMLAGAAWHAAGAIRDMSAETLSFETALRNIPFGLDKARAATGGLVNDMQLAASAAQGVALGVVTTEEEYASLAEAATKLGIKLRIGPTQALDNMMTALGRGSSEILDNLGVAMKASEAYERYAKSIGKTADELTDAEKKVAFKTEAIKALKAAAADTTVELESGAAAVQRFGVRFDNAKESVKGFTVEVAGGAIVALENLTDRIVNHEQHVDRLVEQGVTYAEQMRRQEAEERARTAAKAAFLRELGKEVDLTEDELKAYEAAGQAAADRTRVEMESARWLKQAQEATSSYIGTLLDEAEAHLKVWNASEKRRQSAEEADKALWKKLEERNAKAEEKAIEEAFFAANEMGPALPPGFERKERSKGKRKDPAMEAIGKFSFGGAAQALDSADPLVAFWAEDEAKQAQAREAMEAFYAFERDLRDQDLKDIEAYGQLKLQGLDAQIEAAQQRAETEVSFWGDQNIARAEADAEYQELLDRRLEAELNMLEQMKAITDDKLALAELEHQKEVALMRKKEREAAQADKAAEGHRKRAASALKTYGDAAMEAGEALYEAIFAAAAGQEQAFARAMYAFTHSTAKEMGLMAAKEAVLALVSLARYDFGGAAAHGAAAAAAGALAAALGGAAYGIGTTLPSDVAGELSGQSGYREPGKQDADRPNKPEGQSLEKQEIPVSPAGLNGANPLNVPGTKGSEPKITVEKAIVLGADAVQVGLALEQLQKDARRATGRTG